jgi:hypothetical protein
MSSNVACKISWSPYTKSFDREMSKFLVDKEISQQVYEETITECEQKLQIANIGENLNIRKMMGYLAFFCFLGIVVAVVGFIVIVYRIMKGSRHKEMAFIAIREILEKRNREYFRKHGIELSLNVIEHVINNNDEEEIVELPEIEIEIISQATIIEQQESIIHNRTTRKLDVENV